MTTPDSYRIVVQGQLNQDWASWFEGLAITYDAKSNTVLTGPLEDQASLYGILNKVSDRGLTLLQVTRIEAEIENPERGSRSGVPTEPGSHALERIDSIMKQNITDEFMRERRRLMREYCLVLLKAGPKINQAGVEKIIWEHGRRNYALLEDGVLAIVCPVTDGSDFNGIYIFNANPVEVNRIMEQDPGVRAQVFSYETHVCRGFPGQCLPK